MYKQRNNDRTQDRNEGMNTQTQTDMMQWPMATKYETATQRSKAKAKSEQRGHERKTKDERGSAVIMSNEHEVNMQLWGNSKKEQR